MAVADLLIAVLGLAMMAVGLWWINPGTSLAVVGGVLFFVSVVARFARRTPAE